jgi:hypothetical protein
MMGVTCDPPTRVTLAIARLVRSPQPPQAASRRDLVPSPSGFRQLPNWPSREAHPDESSGSIWTNRLFGTGR